MTDPDDSAFAMPAVLYPNGNWEYGSFGLTKREFFAAAALQGLLANEQRARMCRQKQILEMATSYADQLIKELNS